MKKNYFFNAIIFLLLSAFFGCKSSPNSVKMESAQADSGQIDSITKEEFDFLSLENLVFPENELPVSSFFEIWAYIISGSAKNVNLDLPVSDLVYFGAEVNRYGHLADVPSRSAVKDFTGRAHFSVTCPSYGLSHFVIEPGSKARKTLISEIINASKDFDGLNIDMENIPSQDADNFLLFLSDLYIKLKETGVKKIFSVCVPGRTKQDSTYNYEKIAARCDRVFVMAYDEHWATSKPGPVASMVWCKNVADYALKTIGKDKLIMGAPFYGRAWGDTSVSRALINSTTEELKQQHKVGKVHRVDGVPTFSYEILVKVTVYYEDEVSLATRMYMYRKQGVRSVGFWRLGQEPVRVWPLLILENKIAKLDN